MHFSDLHTHILLIFTIIISTEAALSSQTDSQLSFESPVLIIVVSVCFMFFGVIILVFLCGGCTGMEVGSEDHPAAGGGSKTQTFNSHIVTDPSTQVMFSSYAVPGDSVTNPQQSQPLMYSLEPTMPSAPGFAGYQSVPTQPTGGWGQGQNAHSVQHNNPQSPGVGSHRPVFGSEPPPPSYNESVRGSDFQGWR